MKSNTLAASLLLVAFASTAHASRLVVMGVNLNGPAPAGQKVYTIGFDTQGASGALVVGNIYFEGTGPGGNPIQSNADGAPFDSFDDNPSQRQEVETLGSVFGEVEFKQYDSWFYASFTGTLNFKSKVITTDPVVGSNGLLWLPFGTGITGGQGTFPDYGSGLDFGITATYGPFPTSVPAGVYPLLQLRVSGNVRIPFSPSAKLSVLTNQGEIATNVLGGSLGIDPLAELDTSDGLYFSNTIRGGIIPEPSSHVLAGLEIGGFLGLRRRLRTSRADGPSP